MTKKTEIKAREWSETPAGKHAAATRQAYQQALNLTQMASCFSEQHAGKADSADTVEGRQKHATAASAYASAAMAAAAPLAALALADYLAHLGEPK